MGQHTNIVGQEAGAVGRHSPAGPDLQWHGDRAQAADGPSRLLEGEREPEVFGATQEHLGGDRGAAHLLPGGVPGEDLRSYPVVDAARLCEGHRPLARSASLW